MQILLEKYKPVWKSLKNYKLQFSVTINSSFTYINECKNISKQKVLSHIWIIYKNIMRPSNYDFEAYKRNGLRSTIWVCIISHLCDI